MNVSAGSTVSASLTLTSILGYGYAGKNAQLNAYNFPVSLQCSNLPPHATCTFTYSSDPALAGYGLDPTNPTAVNIPCSGTTSQADGCTDGHVTVTINTNVAAGTTTAQIVRPAPITLALMFGFGMIGLFFRRRVAEKSRYFLIMFMAVLGGALAISLAACSTTNLSPQAVLKTPAGQYAVSITAQQVGTLQISLPTGPVTTYGSQNQVSVPFTINLTVQ